MARSVLRRRKQHEDRRGWTLITASTVLITAILVVYVYYLGKQVAIDKDSLCPVDGPANLTVILVDQTDPLTVVQQASVLKHLEDIKAGIERYGAIGLYSVGPIGEDLLRKMLYICNPGRSDDINPLYGNPQRVERKWREAFSIPLNQMFEDMTKRNVAETSPILESIQSLAITSFEGDQVKEISKRLIIISDMLQHTFELSQYEKILPFHEFRKSSFYRKIRTDLEGVDVEIIYIRRDTKQNVQGKAHIEFWKRYFRDMGGTLTHVISLEG